jgi:hypothetical protein
MPRTTHADLAVDLFEWLYDQPLGRWHSRLVLASMIGMGTGRGFDHVLQMVSTMASVDGLAVCYPVERDYAHAGMVRLARDPEQVAPVLVHLNATSHGLERRRRETLRCIEANGAVGKERAVARLTRAEFDAIDGAGDEMRKQIEALARRVNHTT